MNKSRGFSAILTLVIIAVAAGIVFLGYKNFSQKFVEIDEDEPLILTSSDPKTVVNEISQYMTTHKGYLFEPFDVEKERYGFPTYGMLWSMGVYLKPEERKHIWNVYIDNNVYTARLRIYPGEDWSSDLLNRQNLNSMHLKSQEVQKTIAKIFESNGFTKDTDNSSLSEKDDVYDSYVQSYAKQDNTICSVTTSNYLGIENNKQVFYIDLQCSDKGSKSKSAEAQQPFLIALSEKLDTGSAYVIITKQSGPFYLLGVGGRRGGGGYNAIAKKENGNVKIIARGHEYTCEALETNNVPKEFGFYDDCLK